MAFQWDESKRRKNLAAHAIDFLKAVEVFDGRPSYTYYSPRGGEDRWATVAAVRGRFMTVVWTWRGADRRLISARRARDAEKRAYRQLHGAGD